MPPTMTTDEYQRLIASGKAGSATPSEAKQQAALVEWAGYAKTERPALACLLHVPNGGARSARSGAKMKRLGAKAGVPDLCLAVARSGPQGQSYGALWIEMKTVSSSLTKSQRAWRRRLLKHGHAHTVCRSWTEARAVIEQYLDGQFVEADEQA